MDPRKLLFSLVGLALSLVLCVFVAEGVLRLKNRSMRNYDIEMWRYARELKRPSEDPGLGHVHLHDKSAILQSVEIRLNEYGLRGPAVPPRDPARRRILVLGGSITLGWGVPEDQTMPAQLAALFHRDGQEVEVLNAGIGNYNAPRYVRLFMKELKALEPTDILVHYFLRDAEELESGGGNFLLRNSELAVTLWILKNRITYRGGENGLVDHYRNVYADGAPGLAAMEKSLADLAEYGRAHGIRMYLAMTPDVHNLENYPFEFVHERVKQIALRDGYIYVDLYPALAGLPPEQIWAMPGDPHPNALGQQRMAEAIYPALALP